jgi:small subunit ribosomal protein S8
MDPIADMLIRLKNAVRARKTEVEVRPVSKLKVEIVKILKREGYVSDFKVEESSNGGRIVIYPKYTEEGEPVLQDVQRVSKPSRRVYVDAKHIPWVKNGLGIAVLSTSKGLMTDYEARKKRVGGEVLFYAW